MGKAPIWKTMTSIILEWKSSAGADAQTDFTWLTTSSAHKHQSLAASLTTQAIAAGFLLGSQTGL